eukprot:6574861-Prymnesium_polylepis.1
MLNGNEIWKLHPLLGSGRSLTRLSPLSTLATALAVSQKINSCTEVNETKRGAVAVHTRESRRHREARLAILPLLRTPRTAASVSYTHLRAHETLMNL